MRMTAQVTYIFIPIVSLKDSFCHRGKSKLGIGLFIHELLREPLIVHAINLNARLLQRAIEINNYSHITFTPAISIINMAAPRT